MYPRNNQPAILYRTAKTHIFNNINEVKKEKLKFRPIIDQTGTYTYNVAQVISKYLKPLSRNKHTIGDTQVFSHYNKTKKTCPMIWNHCSPIFPLMKPLNIFQIKHTTKRD